jgi:hypothetical protein
MPHFPPCLVSSPMELRKKAPGHEGFHLPAGSVFAVLGIFFAIVLVSRMGSAELTVLAITASVSIMNWVAVRRNARNS